MAAQPPAAPAPGLAARLRTAGRGRSARLAELEQRVAELEDEVQEARRLHRRLAELTDVVEELLVPVALRDEDRVRAFLDSQTSRL